MDTGIIGNGYADNQAAAQKVTSKRANTTEQSGTADTTVIQSNITETVEDGAVVEISEQGKNTQQDSNDLEEMLQKRLELLEDKLKRLQEKKDAQKEETEKKKKALNYSYKKVSASVMRAKTISQASNALTSANSNLSALKRKASSGKYDTEELDIALKHARKMVRAAKKKVAHLKFEQGQEQDSEKLVGEEKKKVVKVINKENKTEENQRIFELEKQLENMKKSAKNGNRKDENLDLMNADMDYLKRKIEIMKQGGGDFAIAMSGVGGGSTNIMESMSVTVQEIAATDVKNVALDASTEGTTATVAASGVIDMMI